MNYDLDTPDGMANAIAWQEQLCRYIREGGMWIVPRSSEVYFIYASKKIAVAPNGGELSVNRVFNEMGYEVRGEL